jgi:hypothetical protein
VKTRTLLLLAVACGVVILAAGTVALLGLAAQDEPAPPAALGDRVTAGDLIVVVGGYREDAGRVDVSVELGGVDDADAHDGFRLVVPGHALEPIARAGLDGTPPCGASTAGPRPCTLSFDLPDEPGTTRRLVLRRGDEQVRWELATG